MREGPRTWTRAMCLRLPQQIWDRLTLVQAPEESYPTLFIRALGALEFCLREKIDFSDKVLKPKKK